MMTEIEQFLSGTIRLSTPLLLAALGELVAQRAGVINISIEGMMLAGAFTGFAASHLTGGAYAGLFAAACVGCLVSALFAWLCVNRKCDQIVVGTGLNLGMLGLTGVLYRGAFGIESYVKSPTIAGWSVPLLGNIPILGQVLFNQGPLVYLTMCVAAALFLFLRSPYGLSLKASGIQPDAADAAGIRVDTIRWVSVLFGGIMAGIAGANLSLVQTNSFAENMTSGRGFIALAIVIFGRWHPFGVILAGLLFGGADQMQWELQARGSSFSVLGINLKVPYQFLLALPYISTLFVLAFASGKYRGPKALGQPYVRSQ